MRYPTFGEVQRQAMAIGLVMSRAGMSLNGMSIHLRFRDPQVSTQTWSVAHAREALEIVKTIAAATKGPSLSAVREREA